MNRPATPTKKTASPYKPSSSNKKSTPSPFKATQSESVEMKLRKNRQKLTHTLDTYSLLIRSKNPIRCLEHNSSISVYCQTDNRLLCSNCIFGKNQHRFHKVSPLDKNYQNLNRDLGKMHQQIFQQIEAIMNVSDVVLKNLECEEIDFGDALASIAKKTEECHIKLDQLFANANLKLQATMQSLRLKHETVAMELNFLQQCYDVNQMMASVDLPDIKDQEKLTYEHIICYTLVNQRKFQGNVWNHPKNEMKRTGAAELQKIAMVCEVLDKLIGAGSNDF